MATKVCNFRDGCVKYVYDSCVGQHEPLLSIVERDSLSFFEIQHDMTRSKRQSLRELLSVDGGEEDRDNPGRNEQEDRDNPGMNGREDW